ncbi:hypothetical protein A176_005655 [Myxococcus hansupus]|uniref:Uncharacterized protein n=1 Tax=Pseudomyxococcus hansupus TaxID=1297742 RepID=A0A0H4X4C0_9BACT|nr:hypothetical protein A176_005655 [Myxococcus hansupus]
MGGRHRLRKRSGASMCGRGVGVRRGPAAFFSAQDADA